MQHSLFLTRVLAPEIADASVEQVPPHSAELVQQMAAGDVIRIPEGLRLQALVRTNDKCECGFNEEEMTAMAETRAYNLHIPVSPFVLLTLAVIV